jgi:hypothetical protein
MASLTISLDDEVKSLILRCAKMSGKTISNYVRSACIKDISDKMKTFSKEHEELPYRAKAWIYHDRKCADCGDEFKNQPQPPTFERCPLVAHHVDGNRENNSLNNLVLLCGPCHAKRHRNGEEHDKI